MIMADNRNLIIGGIIVIIVMFAVIWLAAQQPYQTPGQPIAPATPVQPSAPASPVITAAAPSSEVKYTYTKELVGNVLCQSDQTIKFTLTNIEATSWNIAGDVKVYANNAPITISCDKASLAANESVACSFNSANLGLSPSLSVISPQNKDIRKITC